MTIRFVPAVRVLCVVTICITALGGCKSSSELKVPKSTVDPAILQEEMQLCLDWQKWWNNEGDAAFNEWFENTYDPLRVEMGCTSDWQNDYFVPEGSQSQFNF